MQKTNMQVVILGLIAFITLFQTIQLVRISAKASAAPVKAAPAAVNSSANTNSNSSAPQSMVGGC